MGGDCDAQDHSANSREGRFSYSSLTLKLAKPLGVQAIFQDLSLFPTSLFLRT
jgi:hypothetical protein